MAAGGGRFKRGFGGGGGSGVEVRPGERLNLSRSGNGRQSHPSGGEGAAGTSGAACGRNQPERVRNEIVRGARAHRGRMTTPPPPSPGHTTVAMFIV